MMATVNVDAAVRDLHARIGGRATALVSCEGTMLSGAMPGEVYPETFAVMCATVFGAAATAHAELGRAPPRLVVVEGLDTITILVACGRGALLVAVVDPAANVPAVRGEMEKFAGLLRVN